MNKKSPKGWNAQAAQLWEQGQRQDAIDTILKVINRSSGSKPLELVLQLSYYAFLSGNAAAAAKFLKTIESEHPHSVELLRNLAVLQSRSGQHQEALKTLDKLLPLRPDDPTAYDTLCSCLFKLGDLAKATDAGTQALTLKDKLVTTPPANWQLPDISPDAWAKDKALVISYSLWGDNPRYLRGALDNALAVPQIYPGWTARFYADSTVPATLLQTLAELGADVHMQPLGQTDRHRLAWRFHVANDSEVGRFLVRDVDSVVSPREQQAVQAWLESGKWFHVMRDWQTHTDLILAGMWGGMAGVLPNIKKLLDDYKSPWMETPNIDQWFLRDCIWSYVRTSCLVHDRYFSMAGSQRWPQADPSENLHVGQNVFAKNPKDQAERLQHWLDKLPCLNLANNPSSQPKSKSAPPRTRAQPSINIATPAYRGSYSSPYVRTLYQLLSSANTNGVSFSFSEIDYADIVTARNYLISNFYFNKPDKTHLLFIDDDMGFDPVLLYDMLALQYDVVGAIYPRRQIELTNVLKHADKPFDQAIALGTEFIGSPRNKGQKSNFIEVSQCGTGIMLISRECVRQMIQKCPEIVDHHRFKPMPFGDKFKQFLTPFNKIELDDRELSEDFSFCHRWVQKCGGTILASTSHQIQHVGQFTANTRYSHRWP